VNAVFFKTYVVTSDYILSFVQRNSQSIKFDRLMAVISEIFVGSSKEDMAKQWNVDEHGITAIHRLVKSLGPVMLGESLNIMNRKMLPLLTDRLDSLAMEKAVDLQQWLAHSIVVASSVAVWGPRSPLMDPKVEEAFWQVS
jgi:hypothetical protein